jgi:serine/threonine protein kinase
MLYKPKKMTSPFQPGDVLLGKYRIERVLGEGGMGVVVSARHIELGELFAIKVLLPVALTQPSAMERFLREARASARLKGEHIAKVQDVGRLPEGLPYMVMEYLSGSDLQDLLHQRGPLPPMEAVTYMMQACEALVEAHSLGIVHRDIKPANLFLIRRPSGAPCVKILDFGISKQLTAETAEQHALTRTGMVLGSPLYMSPEQMLRPKETDPRSDIWSLGVVLYELLTGQVPFWADALTELVGMVIQEEHVPPIHHKPDIPPLVNAIVMRCLEKRKELRFQTVQELMEALQAVLDTLGMPPGGGPPMHRIQPSLLDIGPVLPPGDPAQISPTAQTWSAVSSPVGSTPGARRLGMTVGASLALLVVVGAIAFGVLRVRDGLSATSAAVAPIPTVSAMDSAAIVAPSPIASTSAIPTTPPMALPAKNALGEAALKAKASGPPRPTSTAKPSAPPAPAAKAKIKRPVSLY